MLETLQFALATPWNFFGTMILIGWVFFCIAIALGVVFRK